MTVVDELTPWLRARLDARSRELDEDERVARELGGESWSAAAIDAHRMRRVTVDYSVEYVVACTLAARGVHIARWDPARVLQEVEIGRAEVDAKRRILDEYERRWQAEDPSYDVRRTDDNWADALALAVKLLALPCADRAGYREEWRP